METEELASSFLYGWCCSVLYQDLKREIELKKKGWYDFRQMKSRHLFKYRRNHKHLTKEQCEDYIENFYKTYKHPFDKYLCDENKVCRKCVI